MRCGFCVTLTLWVLALKKGVFAQFNKNKVLTALSKNTNDKEMGEKSSLLPSLILHHSSGETEM